MKSSSTLNFGITILIARAVIDKNGFLRTARDGHMRTIGSNKSSMI